MTKLRYEKTNEKCDLWEAESIRHSQPMKPICIGCVWEGQDETAPERSELLKRFKAVLLTDGPIDPLKPLPSRKSDTHTSVTPGQGLYALISDQIVLVVCVCVCMHACVCACVHVSGHACVRVSV